MRTSVLWGMMGAVILVLLAFMVPTEAERQSKKYSKQAGANHLGAANALSLAVAPDLCGNQCNHVAADHGPLPPTPVRDWFHSDTYTSLHPRADRAQPTPDPWRFTHAEPTASPLTPSWRRHGSGSFLTPWRNLRS